MVEFHNPRAPAPVAIKPYGLAIDLQREHNATVGFLANGFPDSVAFLEAVAQALTALVPIRAKHWNKGNASISVPEAMLGEIQRDCRAVIAAYGH